MQVEEWVHSLVSAQFESKTEKHSIDAVQPRHPIGVAHFQFNQQGKDLVEAFRDKAILTPMSSSALLNTFLCATGQWSCLRVALVSGDRK